MTWPATLPKLKIFVIFFYSFLKLFSYIMSYDIPMLFCIKVCTNIRDPTSISIRYTLKSLIPYVKTAKPWKELLNFLKNFQRILRGGSGGGRRPPDAGEFSKICKKCSILAYFSKKFQNYALNFWRFGRKTQLVGKFLRKLWKFLMKIQSKNSPPPLLRPLGGGNSRPLFVLRFFA